MCLLSIKYISSINIGALAQTGSCNDLGLRIAAYILRRKTQMNKNEFI